MHALVFAEQQERDTQPPDLLQCSAKIIVEVEASRPLAACRSRHPTSRKLLHHRSIWVSC